MATDKLLRMKEAYIDLNPVRAEMRQPTAETKSPGFLTKLVEASLRNGTQRRRIGFPSYSSERINSRSTHSMNCFPPTIFTNSTK
jgi:hypothetical protein